MTSHSYPSSHLFSGVKWHFSEAVTPAEKSAILTLSDHHPETVKANRRRRVLQVSTEAGSLFIKHDHPRSLRDLLKGLWRNKSQQEYAAACRLAAAGIATATPLAWGKKGADSFFISRGIADVESFDHTWEEMKKSPENRQLFLRALGAFFGNLFRAGLVHPDMHAGNIVVQCGETSIHFFLLDTYGATVQPGTDADKMLSMLRWMSGWGRDLTLDEREQLLAPVAGFYGAFSVSDLWRILLAEKRRQAAKRWPGLRKRLLKPGSLVYRRVTKEGAWLIARDIHQDMVFGAVHEHFRKIKTGDLLKNDRKRRLSHVVCARKDLAVKEFLKPRWFGRWRYDAKAWLGTHQLAMKRFPVARALAWVKQRRVGWVVYEYGGEDNLPNILAGTSPKQSEYLLSEAGKLLADLHNLGISHGDTKTTNFVVKGSADLDSASLCLVDCDSVKVYTGSVSERFKAELETFEGTIPARVGHQARHAFRASYRKHRV